MQTIRPALEFAAKRLATNGDSPKLESEILLCHVLQKPRSYLYAWPEQVLTPQQWQAFRRLVARREKGEPIAYLTGHQEFWSLELRVSPDTLIPRPDTELLVELTLEYLSVDAHAVVADLGTGSGAVGLAIAKERPSCLVVATDRSLNALRVAQGNAQQLRIDNIALVQGDWCKALAPRAYDVIAANPPYVASDDRHLSRGDTRFEPRSALVGGEDGLDAIRVIARDARISLRPKGVLLVEHGYDQGSRVRQILRDLGYNQVVSRCDLAKRERVSQARLAL